MSLRPTFNFIAGALVSTSEVPAGIPTRFVVERSLAFPMDALRVTLADHCDVNPTDSVSLELGGADGQGCVFTGTIAEIRPRLAGYELFCLGNLLSLVELRLSTFYQQQSAGAVVRDLLSRANLEAGEIAEGIDLLRFAVDRSVSAYAHVARLAEKLGYSLFSDRSGRIHFRGLGPASDLDDNASGTIADMVHVTQKSLGDATTFPYGQQVLDAKGAIRPAFNRTLVVGGESPMSSHGEDKSFWLTAEDQCFQDAVGEGPEWLVMDPTARTKDMAGRFAAGYAATFQRQCADLHLTLPGCPSLELGDAAGACGTPKDVLNTSGYVKAIRHRFSTPEGFVTDLTLSPEGAM